MDWDQFRNISNLDLVKPYCWAIASQSLVLTLGGICVPPTVNCLQYLVTGSTLTAIGLFRLPAPQSGTLSRISSGTRPSVRTVSDGCLKRTCSLDTSDFSALEVLMITVLYKFTYLLTYFYWIRDLIFPAMDCYLLTWRWQRCIHALTFDNVRYSPNASSNVIDITCDDKCDELFLICQLVTCAVFFFLFSYVPFFNFQ